MGRYRKGRKDEISFSQGNKIGRVNMSTTSGWFADTEDIIVKSYDDCIRITKPTLDYVGQSYKLTKNCNTSQTSFMSDIPLGRYEFDEESNEDEIVIYF